MRNAFAKRQAHIHIEADEVEPLGLWELHPARGAMDYARGQKPLDQSRDGSAVKKIQSLKLDGRVRLRPARIRAQEGEHFCVTLIGQQLQQIVPGVFPMSQ